MSIRAITFDFWRTLFTDRTEPDRRRRVRIDALCGATGVSPEGARQALLICESEFMQHHIHKQITLGPADAVRIVARELDVTIDNTTAEQLATIFGAAILEYPPEPIAGGFDAIRAASERFPIGIVSDSGISPGRSLRAILDRNEYTPFFTHMAFSDEVGVSKPQALIFETAARGLGVDVAGLLHIGDLEGTDIQGARLVGAKAALFVGDHDRYRNNNSADFVVEDWAHFLRLLPAIA